MMAKNSGTPNNLPPMTQSADTTNNFVANPPSMEQQETRSPILDYVSIPVSTEEYPSFPQEISEPEPADTIECAKPDRHELISLKEIKTCGIVPALFRFRGRIVKVIPADLSKAITPFCVTCSKRWVLEDLSNLR
jgi:hypothetical protein